MQQGASTADLTKQKKVPINLKTRHLKLFHQRKRNKRRVKKACEVYGIPSKEQNMYYESPEAENKIKKRGIKDI